MASKFVHLHMHTEYSLLDGLSNIKKLINRVKEMDMPAIAMTDHGAMYGAIEFYKAATKEGIKPIVGLEGYVTTIDHKERPDRANTQNYHLLLLAKDEEGYKNLMKLTSIAHIEGYHIRPRFSRKTLEKYSKGIICTSSCALGEVAQHLLNSDYKKAKETAKWYTEVFGDDYYLEVQRHEYGKYIESAKEAQIKDDLTRMNGSEKIINEGVVKLSRELGVPLVATNDAHYINASDATAQDVLVCVATGKLVTETKRIRFVDTPTFYARPTEEMKTLFPDLPDAIENTSKIAEKCDLQISTLGKWFFPKYEVPDKEEPDKFLVKLAHKNLKEIIPNVTKEVTERLDHELSIINQKIMMDLAN